MIRTQKGFIAVLTVIALLAFSASLVFAAGYLSIGAAKSSLALAQGEAAYQALEGCAEDALLLALRDENYAGGTYSYLGASCTVEVAKDTTTWTFDIHSEKSGYSRSLRIVADRAPGTPGTITLASWLER